MYPTRANGSTFIDAIRRRPGRWFETICEEPFVNFVIRYLDKLIDELAKGKKMEKILRQ